jgi:hypothetical protein
MKSIVAAAAALALAIAAPTASAGVVISQDVVAGSNAGSTTSEQTVMVQGHKQKIVGPDRVVITDLDAGKVYVLVPKSKQYLELKFPPPGLFGADIAMYRVAIAWKKTTKTQTVAGYACQEYAGFTLAGPMILKATECVSTDAPGAKEFAEFDKAMVEKLKGTPRAAKGELPEGIPLLDTSSKLPPPFRPAPGFSPEVTAKIQAMMAKNKPITRDTTVSKIELKDLPADTFTVPAGYNKGEAPAPHIVTTGKPGAPAIAPGSNGSPPAAPATH